MNAPLFLMALVRTAAATALLAGASPVHADDAPTNKDCFDCHGAAAAKDADHAPIVKADEFAASAHSDLECTHCHADVTGVPHDDKLAAVSLDACTDCHDDEVTAYKAGSHAQARERGVKAAPDRAGCH